MQAVVIDELEHAGKAAKHSMLFFCRAHLAYLSWLLTLRVRGMQLDRLEVASQVCDSCVTNVQWLQLNCA